MSVCIHALAFQYHMAETHYTDVVCRNACMHTHTCMRIHAQTCIASMHTYMYTSMHTYIYAGMHACMLTNGRWVTWKHAYIHIYLQTYIHIHIHTYIQNSRSPRKRKAASITGVSCMYVCMYTGM